MHMSSQAKVARVARDLGKFLRLTCGRPIKLHQKESIQLHRIVAPAVNFGLVQLRAKSSRAEQFLAGSVWEDLGQYLSSRLTFALGPTLHLQDAAAKAVARSEGTSRDEITLRDTIVGFPGVLDLTARIISVWLDAQSELLTRLLLDKLLLTKNFIASRQRFRIVHVQPGLSDPHEFGRTAALLGFAGGPRIVYKTRPADCEQLWFEGLRWLNRNGFGPRFRIPKVLPREGYCWTGFVSSRSCGNLRAVRRFYFRWGAQAALAQILMATDLHRENWISAGPQPVLVDAELIGDAELAGKDRYGRVAARTLPLILQTGLLPLTLRDRVGVYEGIGPFDSRVSAGALPECWPRYKQLRQGPQRCVAELVRGFEAVKKIFEDSTISSKFFREVIARHRTRNKKRVLLRSTAHYARLLRGSLEPINLISSEARSRYIENACSATAVDHKRALTETEALLWCDIPKIDAPATRPLSRERFRKAVAELQKSARLLRSRVLLGASAGSNRT